MKLLFTLMTSLLTLSCLASVLVYPDRPPAAHTGGFDEPTCYACHFDGTLNESGGFLSIEGVPAGYEASRNYTIVVTLSRPEMQRGGFQLAARFTDGTQAGQFEPLDERSIVQMSGDSLSLVQYIQHTEGGTSLVTTDTARWMFKWVAPVEAVDTVVFHSAGNAANGDASEFGDAIYTDQVWIKEK
jgi:hypothetical protein